MKKWYENSYRRMLIDMHIEEWNEEFFKYLNPESLIQAIKTAGADAAMIYANSHVGKCFWDTPFGNVHKRAADKNFLKTMLDSCQKENIHTIVYFTLVYDNYCYDMHPEWRCVNEFGKYTRDQSVSQMFLGPRYGNVCINNEEYKEYCKAQLADLMEKFDFDGFFLDMTFWPVLCRCESCKNKYKQETGREMPETINWNDPNWCDYQKRREDWMSAYAQEMTDFIKSKRPEISVEHQYSSALFSWRRGVTEGNAKASDYVGGDLYGGINEQAFACKLYRSLSSNQPFEYMTSRCDPSLNYHTCTKSEQRLRQHVFTTHAHHGAFLLIDAIDPNGKIHMSTYNTASKIFEETRKYDQYMSGTVVRDAAIYMSLTSKVDYRNNNKPVTCAEDPEHYPHLEAALGAADILKTNNILYDVVSSMNLDDIDDVKALILPDITIISDEETEKIEKYVRNGGNIYVSGSPNNDKLKELLGIKCDTQTKEDFTYILPIDNQYRFFDDIEKDVPLTIIGKQPLAKTSTAQKIAVTMLPYTDPQDPSIFASIHSNPPGIITDNAAMTYKQYGKGTIIWSAAPIEKSKAYINRKVFCNIVEFLLKDKSLYSDAPAPVEVLAYNRGNDMLIYLLNQQDYDPLVKVSKISVKVKTCKAPKSIKNIVSDKNIDFTYNGEFTEFVADELDVWSLINIEM